ncbi:MAG: hypothetical protein IR164_15360 [Devosia sp.]|uniref:hypothetical protein n=1 Tax=Devosia sp. TaxID=1871048 RepID=UPI001A0F62CE|nr:hypothetical protein [Devosia sp.]MBF0680303.1 hypothetical protein [Devosia sp.]
MSEFKTFACCSAASVRHQRKPAIRIAGAALAMLFVLGPAQADEATEYAELMGNTVTSVTKARAIVDVCDERFPDSRIARSDFMAGWAHVVDLPTYDQVLAAAIAAYDGLGTELDAYAMSAREEVATAIEADASPCHDLAQELNEEMLDLASSIRSLSRNAEDFGIEIAEAPAPAFEAHELGVMPLATLWTRSLAVMEAIGTKASAEDNRHLREAREEYLLQWLEAQGQLHLRGRIVSDDELREWRGDWQSSLEASCSDFATERDKNLFAAGLGTDVVITGSPRWVLEQRVGGVINLGDCRVSNAKPTNGAPAIDDSAGLMLRPLEFTEAFASPNAGLAMNQVDRVLYAADFANRIDGFGNGYIDRQEDIYVLLRDGTAYRHEWDFAFTDLNVGLSRQREPERWFTWSDHWGKVMLVRSGGLDQGEEIDLSEAQRLVPMPADQRLEGAFYYLQIASGGARSDREYVFSADGTVTYTRGGFIAGNFAGSFITVVPGDEAPQRLTYRFENFTMIIDGPDGQERHFFAMIDGGDPASPEELLIRGQVYWEREEE